VALRMHRRGACRRQACGQGKPDHSCFSMSACSDSGVSFGA
jgi:hypothetical protein